ncbi:hypothetical protein WMC41_09825 [Shinella yambaruensis]|uniref:hypothetical protein n=1 Tax=Shinella yambaruensis TaxID=415996 RepID=UPI003D793749
MTNEPSWQLTAGQDDDGDAFVEALIKFDDSSVVITVVAPNMPTAASRLLSIIGGISQDGC